MASDYSVREYEKRDWQMVSTWWNHHASERSLVEAVLPPVGVVIERKCEPVAAVWVHLSAGVGVAFLESPVTRPGMNLAEVTAAMSIALDALEEICRTHDYGLMIANTLPGIARWLTRHRGFEPAGDRVQLLRRIR